MSFGLADAQIVARSGAPHGTSVPLPQMWNSPRQTSAGGKRYSLAELAALLEPLGLMLDALRTSPPPEVVTEPILQRMETEELVYAIDELFESLLNDLPHPAGGHPGYLEALIAELLDQCCGLIELELSESLGTGASPARRAGWQSFASLCGQVDASGRRVYPMVEHLELIYDDPHVHLCPLLTADLWQEMLLGEHGSVAGEFLWDYDWRTESFLENRPASEAWMVAEQTDTDLDLVHRLPRSPSPVELARARRRLDRLVDAHLGEHT